MRTLLRLGLVVALAGSPALVFAGGTGRVGTAGALELLIPTDARGVAMGGSALAEYGGTGTWFWNPAGAATIGRNEVGLSYRKYIADIALSHLAYAHNAGSFGVIGISAKVLSAGEEEVYTTDQPDGTGETFSTSFVVVGLSYARMLTDRVSVGINGHYIAEKIHDQTAQGVAFDVGFVYRPSWEGMTFGVVMKNYGPRMAFDGPGFDVSADGSPTGVGRTQSASFELPSFIQFGLAWDAWQRGNHELRLVGAFQSNNFSEDEFRVGTEWGISRQLFLRGGYAASRLGSYMYGFSAGLGLRLPLRGTLARIDYAWADAGVFDNNHLFSVTFAF